MRASPLALPLLLAGLLPSSTSAQWDPINAQWLKSDPTDVRVMTYNILDGICSECSKAEGFTQWEALARTVAALQPDVLVMQEVGERPQGGVDSVSNLTTAIDLFLHGGTDPFLGGAVTAYVQKYAPGYDLPYVFVSSNSDGFNRNVLLSRIPFGDTNGDTRSTLSDIPVMLTDAYQTGGNGGIRGFLFVEMDLDDAIYAGDLVLGGAHLKAGGSSSDHDQRVRAAQNVAYYVDYLFQGAGGSVPDPNGKIFDNPAATKILDPNTTVVLAGDWNEDEQTNGAKGPADWLTRAQLTGGTDGTDRDRSDMTYDSSVHFFTGSRGTIGSGSTKLDYIAWQDSIATLRRSFVFNTAGTPIASLPPEVLGFFSASSVTSFASDHRPVVADIILPQIDCQEDIGFAGPGTGVLSMCGGPLVAGNTADILVAGAAPSQAAVLLLSNTMTPTPILGGTLVPIPTVLALPTATDPSGDIAVPGISGGSGPATVYIQVVYADPSQAFGLGFTNAIAATFLP